MRLPTLREKPQPFFLKFLSILQKRKFGFVLNPTHYWGRMLGNGLCFYLFHRQLMRKSSPLSQSLRHLVMTRVSQILHCAFCIDFNALKYLSVHSDPEKLHCLSSWQTHSHLYTPREKIALQYAEYMSGSYAEPDVKLIDDLSAYFTDEAILELTTLVAFQNLSARFNHALQVPSQGLCSHNIT